MVLGRLSRTPCSSPLTRQPDVYRTRFQGRSGLRKRSSRWGSYFLHRWRYHHDPHVIMISTAVITVTIAIITAITTIVTTITSTGVEDTPSSGRVSPPSTGTLLLRCCGGGWQQQEGSAQSRRQVARDRLFRSCFIHLCCRTAKRGLHHSRQPPSPPLDAAPSSSSAASAAAVSTANAGTKRSESAPVKQRPSSASALASVAAATAVANSAKVG